MTLFDFPSDSQQNLLPKNGTVNYYGKIFSQEEADSHYDYLFNQITWTHDEALIFGKLIQTKRKVAWLGDQPFQYTYSGKTKTAKPWCENMLNLKSKIEDLTGEQFNSCLLNLYHDGSEGMAYHSDGEKDLKKNGAIASVSFGAERKFFFKHKISSERIELVLEHGSLLIMKDETQDFWLHRLPTTKKNYKSPS